MAYEVVMPRLGWNMESGALSSWRKKDGDFVNAGDILFEVESEKAFQEVEAVESGILRIPPDSPGLSQIVPVGTRLAYLLLPGEELPVPITTPATPNPVKTSSAPLTATLADIPARPGRKAKAISPRAARLAAELGIDWSTLQGSGRTGRIVERDVRQVALQLSTAAPVEVEASPLARRLAQEMGLDLAHLAAQMPGKRIERADVETAIRSTLQAMAHPSRPASEKAGEKTFARTVQPISSVRRLTASRLASSAHSAAAVTLTTEADATELVQLRRQLKEDGASLVPTYTDLMVCLVAHALVEHPQVNAHLEGEMNHRSAMIVQPGVVNIGIAVDTERGLLVPVLPAVQTKSLRQIAQESEVLIEKARSGKIHPDEMKDGTFTITNLGMYDIDAFTPIINLPECAVLGVGRIVPKQIVLDAASEQLAIRHMLFLSLTFDHRLVDGAPAARFLQRVKQLIEEPYLWLVNG
jgi:pyruvate dehydrogenase E2 component (dihydrolipoamide acetyltransferase)